MTDTFFSMDGARTLEGTVAGACSLEELLGIGGLGPVFRAYDRELGREVALRRVWPSRSLDLEAWRVELDALARLDAPTVARVLRAFEADGILHVAGELVRPSASLMDRVRADGPLAPREVARLGIAVLGGLCAMHEVGALHRALDPREILLRPDGIPTIVGAEPPRRPPDPEAKGVAIGNPTYTAVETFLGDMRHTPASDLYALGCSLFLALTGRAPYHRSRTVHDMVTHKLGKGEPTSARADAPAEAPDPLIRVIDGLMAPDPGARPSADGARQLLLEAAC